MASGGSKKGFRRVADVESKDSVAAMDAGRIEGGGEYEMRGFPLREDEIRVKEWSKQARN